MIRSHARQRRAAAAFFVAALSWGSAAISAPGAPEPPRWAVDEADPAQSVPPPAERDRDPLQFGYFVADLVEKGEAATARGDHAQAAKLYAALAKAAPNRSLPWGRLCRSYEALGRRDDAIASCRAALGREGVTALDGARFVRLLLAKPGPLAPGDEADARAVVAHLATEGSKGADAAAVDAATCELALRLEDLKLLGGCAERMTARAPEAPETISFLWALALRRGDRGEARRLVEKAEAAGVKPEGIRAMQAALDAPGRWSAASAGPSTPWLALLAGVTLAAAGAARVAARRRGRARG